MYGIFSRSGICYGISLEVEFGTEYSLEMESATEYSLGVEHIRLLENIQ